jgi:hypothetical protein
MLNVGRLPPCRQGYELLVVEDEERKAAPQVVPATPRKPERWPAGRRYHALMASPDLDRVVRHRVYSALAAAERAPSAAALARALGVEVADVRAALERLHAAHALVLDAATREVRMALPFSNGTTSYRVESGDRAWDAN